MLTRSEQLFLNKIKKFCRGYKRLIVIHNLIHCYEKGEVEDYIENILKKSTIHSFEPVNISYLKGDENYFNKYFIETEDGESHEFKIFHFIMANDKEKSSQKLRYFNEPTIQILRDLMDVPILNKKI
jgi:hypothetical protein